MEKVAIPIWENRVSPVLDTAACLLVVRLNGQTEQGRDTYSLTGSHVFQRVQYISGMQVNTMLCGALSRPLHMLLIKSGIKVYPWLTGDVAEILEAYKQGKLEFEKYSLPGCGRHRRRQGRGCDYY